MTTLDRDQAKWRLQDGELLQDKPRDHARWKLGKDTVRDITVQKWIKLGKLVEVRMGVWKWVGDQPYFVAKKRPDSVKHNIKEANNE